VEQGGERIARGAERQLEALVAVSSPSGDVHGAEEAISVCAALLPDEAEIERVPCSSPGFAPDLIARLRGSGARRLLLIGHVDTVVGHDSHRPLERRDDRLYGSGAIDMKGGVVLSIGVLRELAARAADFAEVALLLVTDEEWRTSGLTHVDRFADFDAALCFEAGQRAADGGEGVIVRRKAAGTVKVSAHGVASHSGSAPDKGRNALLALAAAAQHVAAHHDPNGPDRLSAVPTILNAGEAFNVVPPHGELYCDVRADRFEAFAPVIDSLPAEVGGARLEAELVRAWPGMDAREQSEGLLAAASELLGRPVVGEARGGASDASHVAARVPLTVDGLGPRGGGAHNPDEYVLAESLPQRAEVALAVVAAALAM
jgi:glutamate carboxypeptidase